VVLCWDDQINLEGGVEWNTDPAKIRTDVFYLLETKGVPAGSP
jgi:hypothetical protein